MTTENLIFHLDFPRFKRQDKRINKLTPDRGARVSPSSLLKQGLFTYEIKNLRGVTLTLWLLKWSSKPPVVKKLVPKAAYDI